VSLAEVAALKAREPMSVKKELAGRIVADFHSEADAKQAAEDFAREVQQGAEPADIAILFFGDIPFPQGTFTPQGTNVAKFVLGTGMAESRTEAERQIKQGAVRIDGKQWTDLFFPEKIEKATIQVGKKWKKVSDTPLLK
jgi:tyrosyl-tRNA synthetase